MRLPDFTIPIIVWWLIQIIKVIIDWNKERKFHIKFVFRAWWFPSVHSGISTSIATLMLLEYGYHSPEFAIAIVFSFLFWYDAMSVRYEAWKHAKFLNQISLELKSLLNFTENYYYLKERLWHTFIEVIWWIIIWCLLTTILYFYLIGKL